MQAIICTNLYFQCSASNDKNWQWNTLSCRVFYAVMHCKAFSASWIPQWQMKTRTFVICFIWIFSSICVWDNRVQKRTPVQRSPLSAAAHTHPVYCMRVVGTQNAHNLISISTDGRLCSWSLDMLSQPQETLELQQHKQSKAVAVTSLAFPTGDVNNFIVGSEEGTVYTACRHGSRAGILDSFEGHAAPVTGLSTHSGQGLVDFSHLFLTSSIDWTVKLWSQ